MENFNAQENVNEQNVPKTRKEKTIFGLKIAGNVVFYLFILMLLFFSIMNINGGSRASGFPNIFGKGYLAVMTNSMEGEITEYEIGRINAGDLVHEKVFKDDDCSNLKVGDVITFYHSKINALNTHRIVFVDPNYEYVVTMGDLAALDHTYDHNDVSTSDTQFAKDIIQIVNTSEIKGIVTDVKAGTGKVLYNIQEHWFIFIVLPVLIFLLVEIYFVIRNIMELKGAKQKEILASDRESMLAEVEAKKEEMRQQLLAELKAEQEEKNEKNKE